MSRTKKPPAVVAGSLAPIQIVGYIVIYRDDSGYAYLLTRLDPFFEENPRDNNNYANGKIAVRGYNSGTNASRRLGCNVSRKREVRSCTFVDGSTMSITLCPDASAQHSMHEASRIIERHLQYSIHPG